MKRFSFFALCALIFFAAPARADSTVINIMILYTPNAKTWAAANVGGISNSISQAMAKAQLALNNSQVPISLNLVLDTEIAFTENAASTSENLYRLTSADDWNTLGASYDGYMERAHVLRDQYGADFVCLFAQVDDVGGQGWVLGDSIGQPNYAFSVMRVQQAHNTFTLPHEWGHNMGLGHHKAQLTQPGPGLYSYAAGWRWTGLDANRYCSVMTYEAGAYFADGLDHTQTGYFSNPNLTYQGVAAGSAADGNSARALSEVKSATARYRDTPVTSNFDVVHYDTTFRGNSSSFGVPTTMAIRLTAAELDSHVGKHIVGLRFVAGSGIGNNVSMKIWKGGSISGPGVLVYDRNIADSTFMGHWTHHEIPLSDTVRIVANSEYWVGYYMNSGFFGKDGISQVANKGWWYNTGGGWAVMPVDNNLSMRLVLDADSFAPVQGGLSLPSDGAETRSMSTRLEWNAATDTHCGVRRYIVEIDTSTAFSAPVRYNTDTALYYSAVFSASDTYYWRVIARDYAGNSSTGEYRRIIADSTSPSVVTPMQALHGDTFTSTATITWSAARDTHTGIFRYRIQVDTSGQFSGSLKADSYLTDTVVTFSAAVDTYWWRVIAEDRVGNVSSSITESFRILAAPAAGDFNGDGVKNAADVLQLLSIYRQPAGYNASYDIGKNGVDGRIDHEDFMELGRRYGQ